MDDVRIGVINEGPYEPTWFYDSKPYQYRVSSAEMLKAKKPFVRWVSMTVAYEHWAVQMTTEGKLERANDVKPRDNESQLSHRLAGLCPKRFYPQKDIEGGLIKDPQGRTLGGFGDDQEFKDWFMNRVHFRLRKIAEYEEELVPS